MLRHMTGPATRRDEDLTIPCRQTRIAAGSVRCEESV